MGGGKDKLTLTGGCEQEGGVIFEHSIENLVHEIRYHKFAVLHEKIDLQLTFSFTSFKTEYNPLTVRYGTVGKQLLTSKQLL